MEVIMISKYQTVPFIILQFQSMISSLSGVFSWNGCNLGDTFNLAPKKSRLKTKVKEYISIKKTWWLDTHSSTPTDFVIDRCIKPSTIKQQAPSDVGSAWWGTKACSIWLDWLTLLQVSRCTGYCLFTTPQPQRCNLTTVTSESA